MRLKLDYFLTCNISRHITFKLGMTVDLCMALNLTLTLKMFVRLAILFLSVFSGGHLHCDQDESSRDGGRMGGAVLLDGAIQRGLRTHGGGDPGTSSLRVQGHHCHHETGRNQGEFFYIFFKVRVIYYHSTVCVCVWD